MYAYANRNVNDTDSKDYIDAETDFEAGIENDGIDLALHSLWSVSVSVYYLMYVSVLYTGSDRRVERRNETYIGNNENVSIEYETRGSRHQQSQAACEITQAKGNNPNIQH